ncbi:hypothetical protein FNW02_27520 [Komarekiella sp. 'clone 1']|uniref:Uncharacterized protein n=1 Tax=Komarekiella delphini-convector SJRDD-AB1 TaxID=2593771 RepID=A0AA40T217_9NOST|nr:hypothetical protein [Komarekiella delphini-convector]MBD6619474.1 hypothetical protein [Komarekiella delphini-convector SJRDD-AB1]
MAKIVISDLHPINAKPFLHDLTSAQIDATLDSCLQHLWGGNSEIELTTVHDGINNTSSTSNGPFGIYDNELLTLDFSRMTIYLVFLMPNFRGS